MSKRTEKPVPDDILATLLEAVAPVDPGRDAAERLRGRLLDRIRPDTERTDAELLTVSHRGGGWLETSPGNFVKILRADDESMSMLVRLEPGTTFPRHSHPADEETYVVEGETWFGDIHLEAGDYHLAPQGTEHGEVRTDTGCVLFIRKASE